MTFEADVVAVNGLKNISYSMTMDTKQLDDAIDGTEVWKQKMLRVISTPVQANVAVV